MKKTWVLSVLVLAAVLAFGETTGFANVQGSLFIPRCGVGDTLYTNLTGVPINFDLHFTAGSCTATLSWTDADGLAQTFTLNPNDNRIFATSLPPSGAISFSTSGTSTFIIILWSLGTSGGTNGGAFAPCGTGDTVYANLTANPIFFDFAVGTGGPGAGACGVILSWTDADGQAQTMTLSPNTTQGASTSLPSGGIISWAFQPGVGSGGFILDVERTPRKVHKPEHKE